MNPAGPPGAPPESFDVVCADELIASGEPALSLRMVGPPGQTPIRVYSAQDGLILGSPGVLGLRRGGATWILAESSPYPETVPMLARDAIAKFGLEPDRAQTLPAACLLDRLWAGNCYHWLMESVPVVAALEEAGFEGCYIVPPGNIGCVETLEFLDIPRSRIRAERSGCILAKSVFFTESFPGYALAQWPWLIEWVRARARRHFPAYAGPRRVYIARRGPARRVLNEQELLAKLAAHGFVFAYMEDLSFRDQLSLLRDAQIVVGPHGAGLVYAMFMPKNGALIEFFHARYINPCMTSICEILEIDYRMLVSRVNPLDNFRKDELISVEMELFSLALNSVLRRVSPAPT
ncbi:MAG TPA: glycosyltransferase family 61 protein [Rhizomicrobium sp.]|nr:glycosyltransferase family 61 protein [Rhizomicrobium sp.]